jgi:hypothetical protein
VIDFENAWVVDHTVLDKLEGTGGRWTDRELVLTGLDNHEAMSEHRLATRRRVRQEAV